MKDKTMICFHNYKTRELKVTAADYSEIKIPKKRTLSLPPLMNRSKIHLHLE